MRRLLQVVGFALLALSSWSVARAAVIFQAFDQRYADVEASLDQLKSLDYSYVQVSPPQKSLDVSDWWSVYQPVDYAVLSNRLGNASDLRRLVEAAHAKGLKILVDVVLNHMADPAMSGFPQLNYPQFSVRDFHYPDSRPCIADWNSRREVTVNWLCDLERDHRLADLDTSSEHVRSVHKQYLDSLLALGVDGFRFDAMKHIEPEYFAWLMTQLPRDKFYYGEVIGNTLDESLAYTPFMPVTDFHLLRTLLAAFSVGGDLRWLMNPQFVEGALAGKDAIVFSRNHDTVMAPGFFNFGDYRDAMLANAFVIARGVGTPLIYRDDANDGLVRHAVKFHRMLEGRPVLLRGAGEICDNAQECDPRTTLFAERGGAGLMILNSADRWVDTAAAHMPGLDVGCYRELVHGFYMTVGRGSDGRKWVAKWGTTSRGGIRVGPRSALFFVKTGAFSCH